MKQLLCIKNLLLIISTYTSLLVSAQQTPKKPEEIDEYKINLKQPVNTGGRPFPFASIKIVDARYDTTKVGYAITIGSTYKKLTLKDGLKNSAEYFLNKYYQSDFKKDTNTHLVIVVKTLWLHEISPSEKAGYKFYNGNSTHDMTFSEAVVKLESYVEENSNYRALYRMDTAFSSESTMKKAADELLLAPFTSLISKITSLDIASFLSQRKKVTFEMIHQYNISRFNLLCISDTVLTKGVYVSFADFVNRKISYPNFSIEEGKLTDELYVTKDNKKELLTDYWGFCDGNRNYIKLGYSFYPIYKQGNTYELFGSTKISHFFSRSRSPTGTSVSSFLTDAALYGLANANSTNNYLKPLQINMENGTVY